MRWLFALMLFLFLSTIHPVFASMIVFERSSIEVPQGGAVTIGFHTLGEAKELRIEGSEALPDGLNVSITESEGSGGVGRLHLSTASSTPPGDTMIRVLHGDEVYLLRVTVLPAREAVDLYLLIAVVLLIPVIAIAVIKAFTSFTKSTHSLRRTLLSILLIVMVGATTVAPAYGATTSTANVTVEDHNGNVVMGASVVLFDSNYNYLFSANTNSDGIATFADLQQGVYIYEVYFWDSDQKGGFWGSGTLTVNEGLVEAVFSRTTPKIVSVETWESDGDETINIAVSMLNPGPSQRDVKVGLLIDRDQTRPFDVKIESKTLAIPPNSTVTHELRVSLDEPGRYFSLIYLTSPRLKIITDQSSWSEIAEVPGSIRIKPKNVAKDTQTFFVLFDHLYHLIDTKSGKGTERVKWDDLSPSSYIIEVYHSPETSIGMIEFWGAMTTQVSKKTLIFEQRSPTITKVKADIRRNVPTITVTIKNRESYEKKVEVSLILDSDGKAPFDHYLESTDTTLSSESERDIVFTIDATVSRNTRAYVLVKSAYNGNYLITDQRDWFTLK